MYHETKIEDGKMYERSTPHGEWILVCYKKLLDRYIELENEYMEFKSECMEFRGSILESC